MEGKLRLLLLTSLIWVSTSSTAAPATYGNIIVTEVRSIYDADTFKVHIPEWPDIVGKSISIRIRGVDAPELRGKCQIEKDAARLAKQFTVEKLRTAKVIELKDIQRGKYFRLLSDVYVDGVSLGQQLVSAGHARVYDGGKRKGWCPAG